MPQTSAVADDTSAFVESAPDLDDVQLAVIARLVALIESEDE